MTDREQRAARFRFLSEEEIAGLPSRARMAYYIMALAELNRRVNPDDSPMPAPESSAPSPSAGTSSDLDTGPH
jgi:hypothetical protein